MLVPDEWPTDVKDLKYELKIMRNCTVVLYFSTHNGKSFQYIFELNLEYQDEVAIRYNYCTIQRYYGTIQTVLTKPWVMLEQ